MPPLQCQGQRVMDTIIRVIADTYFVFWYFRHYYLAKSILYTINKYINTFYYPARSAEVEPHRTWLKVR